ISNNTCPRLPGLGRAQQRKTIRCRDGVMLFLVLLGNLGFSLSSLALGMRLLLLSLRTHELPERLLGIGFISGGFIANTLGWVLYTPLRPGEPYLSVLYFLLRCAVAIASVLLLLASRRIF